MSTINVNGVSVNKALSPGKYKILYTAPLTCLFATLNARLVTKNLLVDSKVRVAIVPAGFTDNSASPPPDSQWIQPVDLILGPGGITVGIIEDSGIILNPGESIIMYADNDNITGRVHGFVRSVA